MSLRLEAANSQYLTQAAPPILDYQFTVGIWVNLAAVGAVARTIFCLSDTGTTNNYFVLRMTASENLNIAVAAGGAESTVAGATALVAGTWNFVLARFNSTTSRRMLSYHYDGLHAQPAGDTNTRAPTGIDTLTIGALNTSAGVSAFWDGLIGPYFITNDDVIIGGGTITNANDTRKFGRFGPFALPHLADHLMEWRSFRTSPTGGDAADVYTAKVNGGTMPGPWVNNGGAQIGPHTPLSCLYRLPQLVKLPLVI